MRNALTLAWLLTLSLVTYSGQAAGQSAATNAIPPEMQLEPLPLHAPEPKDNPSTPAKIALGRLLFFDPVLSASQEVACATCHHPAYGWTDGRAVSIGVGGTGLGTKRIFQSTSHLPVLNRNAPTIINTAFNGLVAKTNLNPAWSPMFWDARVTSLETQVFTPMRMREEMRGDGCAETDAVPQAIARVRAIPEYRKFFGAAFHQPEETAVTANNLARAIAAFERSLIAANSPFDRFLRGDPKALTAEQQQGLRVFQTAGCIQCHGGPMLSDFKLHVIGVTETTSDRRQEFRTPTLRNLRLTAPYMHNGSLRTIADVLVFYDNLSETVAETLDGGDKSAQPPLDPLLRQLNLNPEDYAALTAFLDALNDDAYDQSTPRNVPSGLPVSGIATRP